MAAESWADLLVGSERFTALYGELPALEGLVLRSVHLNPSGSAVTLRVEFPWFPQFPPSDWTDAGCDRFEAQIEFLAVDEDLRMRGIPDTTPVDVAFGPRVHTPVRMVRVAVSGPEFSLSFAAHCVKVGHLNAYRSADGDADSVRRWFDSPLDRRRHTTLPPTTTRGFYERV